jgi:hypothetical protein
METCNAQRLAAGDVREVVMGGQTGSSVKVESAAHLDTADGLRTGGADGMSRQESNQRRDGIVAGGVVECGDQDQSGTH